MTTVSPTKLSVSLLCFYTLVAIPALAQTTVGTTHQVAGITLYCYDIMGKIDNVCVAVNALVFSRLTNTSDKSSAGQVTITLHHYTILNEKSRYLAAPWLTRECRASVWFVQNLLLDRFNFESFNKSFDISRFNARVFQKYNFVDV